MLVYLDRSKNEDQLKQLNFYDMMRKVVLAQSLNEDTSNRLQFNLSDQPKGLYMMELIGEHTRLMEKLIIE